MVLKGTSFIKPAIHAVLGKLFDLRVNQVQFRQVA